MRRPTTDAATCGHRALLTLALLATAHACGEEREPAAASNAQAAGSSLAIGGLEFPPLATSPRASSAEMQQLLQTFARFLADSRLPAIAKDDFVRLGAQEIAQRKKDWVDRQIVERFRALHPTVVHLEDLLERIPDRSAIEKLAATALTGCAQHTLHGEWSSLESGAAEWMLGPKADIPSHFTPIEAAEVEAKELETQQEVADYYHGRIKELRAPNPSRGLQNLKACMTAARASGDELHQRWHDFCADCGH